MLFPDQDGNVSSDENTAARIHSSRCCHTDETGAFHNKSWLLAIVEQTTRIFFHNRKKRTLGKYLQRKRATDGGGKEENRIPE